MHAPQYFKPQRALADGGSVPPPLCCTVSRRVRFNEVDPLNVMWHGYYASYFEDARVAFGNRYGLSYRAMYDSGVIAPVKQMRIDYEMPLHFEQECRTTAILFWSDAARLNFEYMIRDANGAVLTRGYTVQLFLTLSGELLYAKPDFYEVFCERWLEGNLEEES